MKSILHFFELILVTCIISLVSLTSLFWIKNLWVLLCIIPLTQIALVLVYRYGIRIWLENRLSGTVCEPTQKDCYNTEDESEVTDA
ncbi:MAG: hypothetical protein IKE65_05070 [Clostridia bacterium]|nr:hypothetical protein [Clostridia bacterium]